MRIDELIPRPTAPCPLEIPVELHASVMRHQSNLAALIGNLRAAGLQEDMIAKSVRGLIDSYAEELTTAIRAMTRTADHA